MSGPRKLTESEALVTGALAGLIMYELEHRRSGVQFQNVALEADQDGDYKSALTVTMASGAVLRVIVVDVTQAL